ncbi:hypothetical protein DICPUDRAFT_157783 [Dictyostelium purpureum]|uniref:Methyltransferase type 11 domain-containing protein n=1 Tax=Dictyostelium purpureum TaxID=5786 RepID=F0ZZZ9_DICPU|nr:uncharacterized protein DICPUDRAFT_157783 [Dictyostelium purpureum]EGC30491.1 hypothetical protein DICPUDRAFT_157783 [Dictyostelium purpureum]|eukprot:XP_003292993.1 hypothetical protein DICPUDRAFT_157783 [Dictyostelium purpureum]
MSTSAKPFDDKFGSVSKNYKNFRPTYSDELFSIIDDFCAKDKRDLAIDIGCGSGQATVRLSEYFKKVIGYEPSEGQIQHAEPAKNVEYKVSTAEKIDLPNESVDLITVAQAAHWFNLPVFYDETKRLLKNDGSLIIWSYGLMNITNNDAAQKIHQNHYYKTIGNQYWAPERKYIDDEYRDIKPTYENTTRKTISLPKKMSINDFVGYYSSWSGYANYLKKGNPDVLPSIKQTLLDAYNTTDEDSKIIDCYFPVYMILSKKN